MIRLNEDAMTFLLNREREVGRVMRAQEDQAADRALNAELKKLVGENHSLRRDLSMQAQRLLIKEQKDSFPVVRTEQLRIVRGIRQYFDNITKTKKRPSAEALLFGLAMGDLT